MVINRFDVFWIDLDSGKNHEDKIKFPCVVISPNEMNQSMNSVIVAPIIKHISGYPMRVKISLQGTPGEIILDQLCPIAKSKFLSKETHLRGKIQDIICDKLVEMFSK